MVLDERASYLDLQITRKHRELQRGCSVVRRRAEDLRDVDPLLVLARRAS